jgi:hypothetical protein
MSQDIGNGPNPQGSGPLLIAGLVWAAGVDGQLPDELAALSGGDAHVEAVDPHGDLGSGPGAADADGQQLPAVAQA